MKYTRQRTLRFDYCSWCNKPIILGEQRRIEKGKDYHAECLEQKNQLDTLDKAAHLARQVC